MGDHQMVELQHQTMEQQQQMLPPDMPGMGDNLTTDPDAFCVGVGSVMMLGFQGAFNGNACVLFLFQGWNLDTPTKYALAVVGTLLMGFVSQALVFARKRYACRARGYPLFLRMAQSVFYGVQMVLIYALMLLAMTYEAVLFTALILGLVIGHCVFCVVLADTLSSGLVNDSSVEYRPLVDEKMSAPANEAEIAAAGSPCCSQGGLT